MLQNMSSAGATVSVLIASAQSVSKVFVIGAVGYAAVKFPKSSPLLPRNAIGIVARFSFHCLVIPLIYSTTAQVPPSQFQQLWFVLVASVVVLGLSYGTATLLACCHKGIHKRDFAALRIAATFPNIVALPILIFPSLCEYPVVAQGYFVDSSTSTSSPEEAVQQCIAVSNTMIFVYFFGWSLLFWGFGYPALMAAAKLNASLREASPETPTTTPAEDNAETARTDSSNSSTGSHESTPTAPAATRDSSSRGRSVWWTNIKHAVWQTCTSPGFVALLAGFITSCITPLSQALFEPGGALRFLGSALETLGQASSPLSTLVVAASLVPPTVHAPETHDATTNNHVDIPSTSPPESSNQDNPIMSDPNFGPYRRRRRSLVEWRQSMRQSSARILWQATRTTPELRRLLVWFSFSRLIVSPALVAGLLVTLNCFLPHSVVPPLAQLVVMVNASVPGALIVIVLLQSQPELADTATAVAQVYLPTYLMSIVTIAGWTALGLWLSLPDENGNVVCQR